MPRSESSASSRAVMVAGPSSNQVQCPKDATSWLRIIPAVHFADGYTASAATHTATRSRSLVAHSDDNGKTWSSRVQATYPRAVAQRVFQQRLPQIAVNRDGAVGIAWYDFGSDLNSQKGWLRFTASLDGGETWHPSVAVSRVALCLKDPPQFAAQAVSRGGGRRRSRARADSVDVWVWPSARSVLFME